MLMPYWPPFLASLPTTGGLPADRMFNTGSVGEVVNTNDKFTITIDASQYKSNELEVNVSGRVLSVSGKHEERADEHGSISRSFTRKYTLPDDVDLEQIRSKIVDGKLTIEAAKVGSIQSATRSIPISEG